MAQTQGLTIKDIARLAGTSPTAVSFVLNNKDRKRVKAETRKAILEVVERVGYRQRASAKGLRVGRTFRVGVCLYAPQAPSRMIGNLSHFEIVHCAARCLYDAGLGIELVYTASGSAAQETRNRLAQLEVDGLLFVNWETDELVPVLRELARSGTPAVAIGTELGAQFAWGAIDREASFYHGTSRLIESGLRRIAVLHVCLATSFEERKEQGYLRAMQEAGLAPVPSATMARDSARGAVEAAQHLLERAPGLDAVMLTDNHFAPALQPILEGAGVRVIGFGDAWGAALCDPPIVCLALPLEEVAGACVGNLVEAIERPEAYTPLRCLVACEFIDPSR